MMGPGRAPGLNDGQGWGVDPRSAEAAAAGAVMAAAARGRQMVAPGIDADVDERRRRRDRQNEIMREIASSQEAEQRRADFSAAADREREQRSKELLEEFEAGGMSGLAYARRQRAVNQDIEATADSDFERWLTWKVGATIALEDVAEPDQEMDTLRSVAAGETAREALRDVDERYRSRFDELASRLADGDIDAAEHRRARRDVSVELNDARVAVIVDGASTALFSRYDGVESFDDADYEQWKARVSRLVAEGGIVDLHGEAMTSQRRAEATAAGEVEAEAVEASSLPGPMFTSLDGSSSPRRGAPRVVRTPEEESEPAVDGADEAEASSDADADGVDDADKEPQPEPVSGLVSEELERIRTASASMNEAQLKKLAKDNVDSYTAAYEKKLAGLELFTGDNAKKSTKERMEAINGEHDYYAAHMVTNCLTPLDRGITVSSVMSACSTAAVMWCMSPQFRKELAAHIPTIKAGLRERSNEVSSRIIGRDFFSSPEKREAAELDARRAEQGFLSRLKATVTNRRVPMGVQSAAVARLAVLDQGYDAARAGGDPTVIAGQVAELDGALRKQILEDGLDEVAVHCAMRDTVGARIGADPTYAARFVETAHGGIRPSANTGSGWDRRWRLSNGQLLSDEHSSMFELRPPTGVEGHFKEMATAYATDLRMASERLGPAGVRDVMLGYASAGNLTGVQLGDGSAGSAPGTADGAVQRVHAMMAAMADDGLDAKTIAEVHAGALAKGLEVVVQHEVPAKVIKEAQSTYGKTWHKDMDDYVASATDRGMERKASVAGIGRAAASTPEPAPAADSAARPAVDDSAAHPRRVPMDASGRVVTPAARLPRRGAESPRDAAGSAPERERVLPPQAEAAGGDSSRGFEQWRREVGSRVAEQRPDRPELPRAEVQTPSQRRIAEYYNDGYDKDPSRGDLDVSYNGSGVRKPGAVDNETMARRRRRSINRSLEHKARAREAEAPIPEPEKDGGSEMSL